MIHFTTYLVIEKIRSNISQKCLRSLSKCLSPEGEGEKRTLTADALKRGFDNCCVSLTNEEAALVAGDFNKLLEEVMGAVPSRDRMNLIWEIFSKFDVHGNGSASAGDLKGHYQCSAHPLVISGELSEDEVFLDFLSHFSDKHNNGSITADEWCDYYSAVSSSIANDQHFMQLLRKAWAHY